MMRSLSFAAGFVMLLGAGFTVASWPNHTPAASAALSNDEILTRAYERVHAGMPVSQLGKIGLDIRTAKRLSKLALVEGFMPKDSVEFDALNPVVQECYAGARDCNALIFTAMGTRAVLLVEDGRVTWKDISDVSVADNEKARTAARA